MRDQQSCEKLRELPIGVCRDELPALAGIGLEDRLEAVHADGGDTRIEVECPDHDQRTEEAGDSAG